MNSRYTEGNSHTWARRAWLGCILGIACSVALGGQVSHAEDGTPILRCSKDVLMTMSSGTAVTRTVRRRRFSQTVSTSRRGARSSLQATW